MALVNSQLGVGTGIAPIIRLGPERLSRIPSRLAIELETKRNIYEKVERT
jgi:hypothetical protein